MTLGAGIDVAGSGRLETELLLCCARTHLDTSTTARIRELLRGGVDWGLLIRTAAPHGVTALLYRTLIAARPEGVSEPVLRDLNDRFESNTRRNLVLARELLRLLAVFEARGIRVISFKGPLLAAAAYGGNIALRHSYDLDLLVQPDDMAAAQDVLRSQRHRLVQSHHWEQHFLEEGGRWLVDLHERIAPEYFPAVGSFDELWERRRPVSLVGHTASTLSPEDLLLVLSVQLAKDCREWKQRLVQICDAAELIRSQPTLDWDVVWRRARATGARRILLLDLQLATTLLGTTLPERITGALRREPVVKVLAAEVRSRLFPEAEGPAEALRYRGGGILREDSRFHLRVRERWQDKVDYVYRFARHHISLLVTPTERDTRLLSLPRPLGFLNYLVRPVRVLTQWVRTGRLRS